LRKKALFSPAQAEADLTVLAPMFGRWVMKRILVVDDEPSIRQALILGLTSQEFEVDGAEDGKRGVGLGTRKHYDVLIVDLSLPDTDGLEVIQKIKTHSPAAVSIVITGNPRRGISMEADSQGVSAYLEKPLDLQSVKSAIKRGLEQHELKRINL
jgi:DNA-binding NtrC family response regulator